MWNIHIHTIVFELSLSAKEERKKERKEKRKMMTKLKFSSVVFSNLKKVGGTYTVDLAIE